MRTKNFNQFSKNESFEAEMYGEELTQVLADINEMIAPDIISCRSGKRRGPQFDIYWLQKLQNEKYSKNLLYQGTEEDSFVYLSGLYQGLLILDRA